MKLSFHSFICSFIHSIIYSFINPFIYPSVRLVIPFVPFVRLSNCRSIHPSVLSIIYSLIYLFTHSLSLPHSLTHSLLIHSFIHLFVRLFLYWFIRLFIHSFIWIHAGNSFSNVPREDGEANEPGTSPVTHDDHRPGACHVTRPFEGNRNEVQMEFPEVSFSISFMNYVITRKKCAKMIMIEVNIKPQRQPWGTCRQHKALCIMNIELTTIG